MLTMDGRHGHELNASLVPRQINKLLLTHPNILDPHTQCYTSNSNTEGPCQAMPRPRRLAVCADVTRPARLHWSPLRSKIKAKTSAPALQGTLERLRHHPGPGVGAIG